MFFGVSKTEEHRNNIGKSNKGNIVLVNINTNEYKRLRRYSEEYQKLNLQIWINPVKFRAMNKIEKQIKCEYCGIICNAGNYTRWHGNNCKENK